MRVSLSWLAEWIALPAEPEEIARRLTLGGLEVDAIERTGPDLAGFVVGRVLECGRHPNADRLSLCRVEVGGGETAEIVCGAPNVAAGQKVAVARPGVRMPDGRRLKRSKIRGVVSEGMICSDVELGIGSDAEGIRVLDEAAPVGAPLAEVLPAGDTVLEISLTPNRGDCASVLGVAREVRAHFGGEIALPEMQPLEAGRPAQERVRVAVEDPQGCHRYAARIVTGLRVAPSPPWLAARLEAIGQRPINAVVDATNLVLHELGQPIHAFDLAALRGRGVRVRSAREGEKLVTLDGEDRELDPADLVIADEERAVALAGVMGGLESEVRESTTAVLIESALFQPARVRRSARRHALHTEASYRFERGVDREGVERAADRAARLIRELCGGEVAPGRIVVEGTSFQVTEEIRLDPQRVNRLLGTALEEHEIIDLLGRVGVESRIDYGALRCRIPTHRNDLHRPEDLVEEVGRIYGYDRIEATLPVAPLRPAETPPLRAVASVSRDALAGAGLAECMLLPFLRDGDLERIGLAGDDPRRAAVRVENPVVETESRLRTTLLPGLLRATRDNQSRQVDEVRMFELSRLFFAREGALPDERLGVAAVLTRGERTRWWEPRGSLPIFFEMKGVVEHLLEALGHEAELRAADPEPYLHPGAAARIAAGGRVLGSLGEIHPDTARRFEIEGPCALLEMDLSALAGRPPRAAQYQEVSRHPSVRRDVAVVAGREVPAGELLAAAREAAGSDLVSAELFDRYEGEGVPEGCVSLAFRLVFQRPDRTLTDAEVGRAVERVVARLGDRFGARLR